MAKVKRIQIEGFRSIKYVDFEFPERSPLVLVGENNAGKSNILAAIDFILGEYWPGTRHPENTDFFNRDPQESMNIQVDFRGSLAGQYSSLKWRYMPGASNPNEAIYFCGVFADTGNEHKYIKKEQREEFIYIYVQAERNLDYMLSYRSKYTMLSKLMHRFHSALQQDVKVMEGLEEQFEKTKEYFNQVDSFSNFQKTLQKEFSDLIASMTYRLDIDFEAYNPANFFHALQVQAKEGDVPRSFDELGTGEQQLLSLAFAKAYAQEFHTGVLLAIEEPESHLHPLAQEWLAENLRELAKSEDLQVIITTHSPAFIDMTALDGVVLVSKNEIDGTFATQLTRQGLASHCKKFGAHPDKTNPENIFEFYAANTTKDVLEGFFAKRIVLVEGRTEALSLPIYLKATLLDCLRERICFIPVMGKGSLGRYWRLFTAYGIPTYVIFDNDKSDDGNGKKREDILKAVGYEAEITEILNLDDIYVYANVK